MNEFETIYNNLIEICKMGDLFDCEKLSQHLTTEIVKHEQCNAFRRACICGNLPVAKYLVDHFHINIDDISDDDKCCLMHASLKSNHSLINYLLDKFEWPVKDIANTITSACMFRDVELLQLFIQRFSFNDDILRDHVNPGIKHYWIPLIKKACYNKNSFMALWLCENFPKKAIPEQCQKFVAKVLEENENEIMIKPASKHAIL